MSRRSKAILGLSLLAIMGSLVLLIINLHDFIILERPALVDFLTREEQKKIKKIKANVDFNHNGIDDYDDLVAGARKDAANHPHYDPAYISSGKGYPTEDKGVCTDVIWRAFAKAGYDLRAMVNDDIARNLPAYEGVVIQPDPNIDFRRVPVLERFFSRYAESLPTDFAQAENWQAGDIVIFNPDLYHIGICDKKRNSRGIPYLIHNGGQPFRIDNTLERRDIHSHYRFLPDQLPAELKIFWQGRQ